MSSKLHHALALAQRGFYIFPCESNGGNPVGAWREISSRNPETIKKWYSPDELGWQQDYNIGIDCFKSGLTVVDIDVKGKKDGKKSYERLHAEHAFPETYTVKTPSGGLHLYYQGSGYRNSVEKLAPGLDIRSDGGFVVAPFSVKNEKPYSIKKDIPIAPLPEWLKEKLSKFKNDPQLTREAGVVIREDNDDDIQWATEFLESREPAVEGAGGDHHTFVTICMLKERGISKETALELLLEHWNESCSPPWESSDLIDKINSAYKSAQNATGSKSGHAVFDVPDQPIPPKTPAIIRKFNPGLIAPDQSLIKPRDWVFGEMALAKQVSMLIAMPGIGKSTLTISMGLSKTSGKNILGIEPRGRGAVALFNNEDNMEEQTRRVVAAMQYHGLTNDDLSYPRATEKGSMFFLNGREQSMRIAKRLADGRIKAADAELMVEYALENDVRFMIVDPFSMTHPAAENSNEEIMQIGMLYNWVAEKANCAVMLVHHTRKRDNASGEGHSGNLDSARGASALGGLVRIAYTLDSVSTQEAKRMRIDEKERKHYVMMEQAKANMSAPGIDKRFFKRHGEIIGRTLDNEIGESVGVLLPVNLKDIAGANEKPEIRTLINDIETLVEDGAMSIPDIARKLVEAFPFHSGKQPDTLAKAIYRMFSEDILTGDRGLLKLEERAHPDGGRAKRFISIELNETARTISSLI